MATTPNDRVPSVRVLSDAGSRERSSEAPDSFVVGLVAPRAPRQAP